MTKCKDFKFVGTSKFIGKLLIFFPFPSYNQKNGVILHAGNQNTIFRELSKWQI